MIKKYIFIAKSSNSFITVRVDMVKGDKNSLEDCIKLARETLDKELISKDYEFIEFRTEII
jgi:hypothetical protein